MAFLSTFRKLLVKVFGSRNERILRSIWPIVNEINNLEPDCKKLSNEGLRQKTTEFKDRLKAGASLDDILPEAFAVVREASSRHLKTGSGVAMRPFDVQLLGGVVLHQGKIAEMVTGEGKTLVATLPAYLNALTGKGVHVVTVNDYLARRDRDWMGPVFEALGLTVGAIQSNMDNEDRKEQYACDITYGTNNEFGFDYLRDNMKIRPEDQVQRPLHYAIVDEVDSILIDEARTPLIISGPAEKSSTNYERANTVVRKLQRGRDYEVKEKEHQVVLSDDGVARAERLLGVETFFTGENMEWPHFIEQALRAKELYKRDTHYVVKDGQIVIVDEFTGRLMEGRVWSEGLHQAVEAKEGIKPKEENQTLATITFQNYFKLYDKIAGMTGTAMTEGEEFLAIYKLDVVAVPTNKPLIRMDHPDVVYRTQNEKWRAIVEEIVEYNRIGRPCLVGTISIENSEKLSGMLRRRGIKHNVLNAKHHEREAEIISHAGKLGTVTIATNMAGRGTDIVLGEFSTEELLAYWKHSELAPPLLRVDMPEGEIEKVLTRHWAERYLEEKARQKANGDTEALQEALGSQWRLLGLQPLPFRLGTSVQALGGLHVLGTERHEARRIDNQLRGRCGRQGDPGTSRFYLSLHDDLMRRFASERVEALLQRLGMTEGQEISSPMVSRAIQRAQRKVESWNFDIRKSLLEYDEVMNEQRKIVYSQRQEILTGENLHGTVQTMFRDMIREELRDRLDPRSGSEDTDLSPFTADLRRRYGIKLDPEEIKKQGLNESVNLIGDAYQKRYEAILGRLGEDGDQHMQLREHYFLLRHIDRLWKDHLYAMDQLKAGIGMRAYAQIDPKVAYKREGYGMFRQMITALREYVTADVLKAVEVGEDDADRLADVWDGQQTIHVEGGMAPGDDEQLQQDVAMNRRQATQRLEPIKNVGPKIGRNDPCPCGSGKKYKKCHGASV